jgi:endonuclease/exonuclease/phosphatase family metal-dependent hydrolase
VTAGWEPPPRIETRLRVMTWNLWWRFGPWEARQPAIVATLRRVDADVYCFQEVWETRDGESQVATIAEALGYEFAAAAGLGLDLAPESLGNAIVSRWPIRASESRLLPAPAGFDEMRVVLRAEIEGPRGSIEVFCTHLNWRLDQSHVRQQQLRAVCELIAETKDQRTYPPILCGDLNAEPMSDEIRILTGLAAAPVPKLVFFDSWAAAGDGGPGYTWSQTNPFTALDPEPRHARIDYVLVGYPQEGAAGEPVACRVAGDEPAVGVYPSDHYGVVTELRY